MEAVSRTIKEELQKLAKETNRIKGLKYKVTCPPDRDRDIIITISGKPYSCTVPQNIKTPQITQYVTSIANAICTQEERHTICKQEQTKQLNYLAELARTIG